MLMHIVPSPYQVGGLKGLWAHQLLAVSTGQPQPGRIQPQVLREVEEEAMARRWEDTL